MGGIFKICSQADTARRGRLEIKQNILNTPAFFPAVAFYGGCSENIGFGGGIYRYIKEYISDFDTALGNVTNFLDFDYSKKKVDYIMQKTIKEWFEFKGILFIDSGGYKFTNTILSNKNILKGHGSFSLNVDPDEVLNYQAKMGADIASTLDFPINPNDSKKKIRDKIQQSSKYANRAKACAEENGYNLKIYAAVHGYKSEDILYCLNGIKDGFDGYAVGSLVPIKGDYKKLIDIVLAVRTSIPSEKPLHVFGVSGSMMPILAFLGADTFDSATYVHAGRFGKYILEDFRQIKINKLPELHCNCKICKNYDLKKIQFTGSKFAALISMHNYYTLKGQMEKIQKAIGSNSLEEYINNITINNKKLSNAFEYAKKEVERLKKG